MISQTAPHFLLLTHAQSKRPSFHHAMRGGTWRFVLEQMGGNQRIEVTETEPGVWGERLQVLAVIRGLEALEQPSRVTLITPSRFVGNGLRVNLRAWKENDWQWEHFGEMTPIKNVDLWKRIDQALTFHRLDCRIWDFEYPVRTTERSQSIKLKPAKNRITFEELQQGRWREKSGLVSQFESSIRIKPLGSGRAFGLCNSTTLSTVSYTG